MVNNLRYRPAEMGDAGILFKWKNDRKTRAMSRKTDVIKWDEHIQWLEKRLGQLPSGLYMFEEDGIPVGTVRADIKDLTTELSWTVSPSHRRKGIGKKMAIEIAKIFEGPISAEIRESNRGSIKIAEAAGMKLSKKNGKWLHYSRGPVS